ncbi:type II toxin-antitoxin system VapC family toxin [Methylobacterium sp. NEAU 140]|uniref:type II toxin-antitoxin system VapC family toxin n=1 Tax=Methylobacterium sp. NEAU 140 TaxID=3064945 RepID=UPI002733870F|nr:type II toxin-antitoxin system VapC family toxin [Methylobacterium sp. NEAU 140]MDP4025814.1 type II toxin-antitoxin system VapC family toxin [Methylobacterium sp. NEAU 140]
MIVLDTNVVSELMRPDPDAGVVAWIAAQPRDSLYTTSVTRAEILYGIAVLPAGRRRDRLAALVDAMFAEDFAGRVLPFDAAAAPHYARIVSGRRSAGAPIDGFDALIAAITRMAGADIATRDAGGFADCGLTIIDPWQA